MEDGRMEEGGRMEGWKDGRMEEWKGEDKEGIGGRMEGGKSQYNIGITPEDAIGNQSNLKGIE